MMNNVQLLSGLNAVSLVGAVREPLLRCQCKPVCYLIRSPYELHVIAFSFQMPWIEYFSMHPAEGMKLQKMYTRIQG